VSQTINTVQYEKYVLLQVLVIRFPLDSIGQSKSSRQWSRNIGCGSSTNNNGSEEEEEEEETDEYAKK
jgi:hypothetical protein